MLKQNTIAELLNFFFNPLVEEIWIHVSFSILCLKHPYNSELNWGPEF